jgi:hypothetical protein
MSLDKSAHDFNEGQRRYRESEWAHRHTAGRDHRELIEALRRIERSLNLLVASIVTSHDA